jgi:hypothetical protein
MNDFVPSGYISIREALNRLGRKLCGSEWTGEEEKARSGLMSEDEWLRIRDMAPARGGGEPRSRMAARPHLTGNPSDPRYQEEYRAHKRLAEARHRLHVLLEAGDLEAAILDPWKGQLHRASTAFWRRHDAGRMIENGQAPIPRSPNLGTLWVKEFDEGSTSTKPIPQSKIADVIRALQEKVATESLTRPQQKDFVRRTFPHYRVTERQFSKIFQAVPVLTGRPKKSNEKV